MNRRILWKTVFLCLVLILVLVILYSGLRILESTVFSPPREMEVAVRKTITKNGTDYYPRQDINVIMLLGVDQEGPVQISQEPNHGNAVDMVALMVFDEKTQSCTLISINRDTMLDMPALNEYGKEDGIFYGQLAYSHTYGTGGEDSCENTKKTISNLFYGMPIDYYIAMNMDAVAILNDAVGGVTVDVVDDFSQVNASIPRGSVTLRGEQARAFVQSRSGVGDQLNLSRMERQKEYMEKFAEAFRAKAEQSDTFALRTYDAVSAYIVSDMSVNTLDMLIDKYQDYPIAEVLSLEGENVMGEEFYEFYVDEEKLETLILRLLYAPKG